ARGLDLAADAVPALHRGIAGVVREHLRDAGDEHALRPGRALDEQLGEIVAEALRDRRDEILAVLAELVDRSHRPVEDEAARSEGVALLELERDGLEREAAAAALAGAGQHAR